jgi:hypothetical protein
MTSKFYDFMDLLEDLGYNNCDNYSFTKNGYKFYLDKKEEKFLYCIWNKDTFYYDVYNIGEYFNTYHDEIKLYIIYNMELFI